MKLRWEKADGRMPVRVSDVLECARPEPTSREGYKPTPEELRRRSERHDVHQAKTPILQRIARGLPINVFERKLIAGDLPPGL